MTHQSVRRLAQRSRAQLKKRYPELKRFLPNLPPLKVLTDEQVFRILRCTSFMDFEIAKINVIVVSQDCKIEADENPNDYCKLLIEPSTL